MIFSAIKRLKTIFEPDPPEATNYHLHLSGARLASKVQLRQLSVLKHRTTAVVAIRMLLYLIFTLEINLIQTDAEVENNEEKNKRPE